MNTINIQINLGTESKSIYNFNSPITINEIWDRCETELGLSKSNFFIVHNGRLTHDNDICTNGSITIIPRLYGGKGGFGSMLRAIGAQIEKTTNREACRDLSGRRLRDINEEKRLKAWIEKQSKREEEAAERKKKKLQKLFAEPKHEFKDKVYEQERSILTEKVGDAVEEGFKVVVAGTSGVKRKTEEEFKSNKRKVKTLLDMDIDSDEIDTSDESDNESKPNKVSKTTNAIVSNDSGHSSDESDKTNKIAEDGETNKCTENNEMNKIVENGETNKSTENDDTNKSTENDETDINTESNETNKSTENNDTNKNTENGETNKSTENNDMNKSTENDETNINTESNETNKSTENNDTNKNTENDETNKSTENGETNESTENDETKKNIESKETEKRETSTECKE